MKKSRKLRSIAIIALLVAIVGLTVGFAALSQTLTINGSTTVKGNIWSIIFSNPVNTTVNDAINTGKITAGPTLGATSTSLDFAVELVKPGDEVSFTVDVQNDGEIAGKVISNTIDGLNEATARNISYTITYLDGTEIKIGDVLAAKEKKALKVTVKYDPLSTEVLTEDVVLKLTASITYEQVN